MNFIYLGLFAIILALAVSAQDSLFYITAPVKDTTYTLGQAATIQWKNSLVENVTINVIQGSNNSSMQNTNISLTAMGNTNSYSWQVPIYLNTSQIYAFEILYNNNGIRSQSYSNQFKVKA